MKVVYTYSAVLSSCRDKNKYETNDCASNGGKEE